MAVERDVVRRPRNAEATRLAILVAARPLFARMGYRGTTVRMVADASDVAPNLVTRYFGGKEGLFLAATRSALRLSPVFAGDRATFGERLADSIVRRWSGIDGEDPLLILQRAAGERPEAAETLARFLDEESMEPLLAAFLGYGMDEQEARDRAAGVDAFVVGVTERRRILRDDLGDIEALRQWLATTIQRLVGP